MPLKRPHISHDGQLLGFAASSNEGASCLIVIVIKSESSNALGNKKLCKSLSQQR